MATVKRLLVLGLTGGLALQVSCGDPLVTQYGGEPLFTFPVLEAPSNTQEPQPGQPPPQEDEEPAPAVETRTRRAGLFWNPGGTATFQGVKDLLEQTANGMPHPNQGAFQWHFYEPPEPRHLTLTASGARYGLGMLFFYDDQNLNGRLDLPDEPVLKEGMVLIVYAPQPLSAADSPTFRDLPAGYQMISRPLSCARPDPGPASESDCGVPLGQGCATDADCNGGMCLLANPGPYIGGYCYLPEPNARGCRPKDGALFTVDGQRRWMKACTEHSQCDRGSNYQCDFAVGACLASKLGTMVDLPQGQPRQACESGQQRPPPMGDGGMRPPPMLDDAGCPLPPPGSPPPPPWDGGGCRPPPPMGDGGMMMPPPPGDGGMMPPPPRDGGMMPPPPGDGGMMPPPPRDGGMMPPPPGDGGRPPPRLDDAGCPLPPPGAPPPPPWDGGGCRPPPPGM